MLLILDDAGLLYSKQTVVLPQAAATGRNSGLPNSVAAAWCGAAANSAEESWAAARAPTIIPGHFQTKCINTHTQNRQLPQRHHSPLVFRPQKKNPKVEFSSDLELRNEFKLFPANIWIFKFFFIIVFAMKMLLDKPYGLLNPLEIECDHFSSLLQAESQFQNSNVGGK